MAENIPVSDGEEKNEKEAGETEPCITVMPSSPKTSPPSFIRQTSKAVRAKLHWQTLQSHVHKQTEQQRTTREKWYNLAMLSKSMSTVGNNVAEFFGVVDENEEELRKRRERWKERSKRMHSRSIVGGGHRKPSDQADALSTAVSLSSDNVFEMGSLGTGRDDVDGAHMTRGVSQRVPHPVDPLASRYRRQPTLRQDSRISVMSYSRRSVRAQPMQQMQKENVWKLAYDGVRGLVADKTSPKTPLKSRSFSPAVTVTGLAMLPDSEDPYLNDEFFDSAQPTSARVFPPPMTPFSGKALASITERDSVEDLPEASKISAEPEVRQRGASIPHGLDEVDGNVFHSMGRVGKEIVDVMLDHGDRHEAGIGIVGHMFNRTYRKSRREKVIEDMNELDVHRPFFTYWVTFVQLACFFFTVAVYGVADWGFSYSNVTDDVLKPSLALEKSTYQEQCNMWLGPRQADLIHLGAKYSPCMRRDQNVIDAIMRDREMENKTACCVRNDGSGCFQSSREECSTNLATWTKWKGNDSTVDNKTSGSVCHLDYRYCNNPSRLTLGSWPDDITQWSICKDPIKADHEKHMSCEIVGRPCCVGIQGQCIITTREHCVFLRGYFHAEAHLCSQVSCLGEICGMIPFLDPERPDQFYRLWTCLFLHAGLVPLLITVVFQMFIMRDMEKLVGWLRVGIIYIMSGIAGSLASAIFLPYHPEAGPTGSQFGILACLFVEVIHSWADISNPWHAILKQGAVLLSLFVFGLLPWIDNWAHLIGFVFGFLLSFAMWPYIPYLKPRGKLISVLVCLTLVAGLFAMLVILFYVVPIYKCPNCQYFNCIPFTDDFCRSMEVNITFRQKY